MPYSVLIVDDEPSAIRYIRNLIAAYLPEYAVAGEAFSGQPALEMLQAGMVDLLITDARMPGMDGIELARRARALSGDLKIVVVSGYADFEYAKGALSAGVNEYLLKPLNIERAVEVLRELRAKLDREYAAMRWDVLNRMAMGQDVEPELIHRYVDADRCGIALVRQGNLPTMRSAPTGAPLPQAEGLIVLPGRDDMEWIALMLGDGGPGDGGPGEGGGALEAAIRRLAGPDEPVSVALWAKPQPLGALHESVRALTRALDERLVMGRSQTIVLPLGDAQATAATIPVHELRKLDFFIEGGGFEALKELLFSWAVDWEARMLPQRAVAVLIHQIEERAVALLPQAQSRRMAVRGEVDELFEYARNAGELMSGLWDVLFAPMMAASKARQPQADELITAICAHLREHCAEPITMQLACVRFGVSQTYLSRLFRKHEGTTFNEYLIRCRLELAKRLIAEQPSAKLRDVATLCGYEDPSYFSKVFRQHEGIAPQQYAHTNFKY